ncbi:MAG: hypothetical protein AAGG75_21095 [Bacteroidota bacterium]
MLFRLALVCFFTSYSLLLSAQTDSVQQVINQTVWKPFMEAFGQLEAERLNSLHTKDVLRATSWTIREGEEYFENNKRRFAKNKKEKRHYALELRLDEYKATDKVAFNTGYYKTQTITEGKVSRTSYGRFHVILRKVDGVWKIAQDWDSNKINGVRVTEADFLKAAPIE